MTESAVKEYASKRLKAEMQVSYGPTHGTLLAGFCVDLSFGGLYLQTEYPLKVGESLILRFTLPGQGKSFSCNSRVAWVNTKKNPCNSELPPGAGLQFVDLPLETVKTIHRFMKHNEIQPTW